MTPKKDSNKFEFTKFTNPGLEGETDTNKNLKSKSQETVLLLRPEVILDSADFLNKIKHKAFREIFR